MKITARFSASQRPDETAGAPHAPIRFLAGIGIALATATVSVGPAYSAERYAAFVMDAQTNEVLHADNAEESRFPASLTKMMTLYMLFEAMERKEISLNDKLTASKFASLQAPTKLGLKRGDQITVDTAIKALVTKSANDVAVMVAERLGGSEGRFASQMTARARELGMTSTRFVNASGLPNVQQRTSAKDMAMLGRALQRDFPQYYSYFKTPGMTWRATYARNHNGLLGRVDGMDGIKTGYTRMSGFNLTSSVERNGHRIFAVVMGGSSASSRDAQMAHLIESAFEEIGRRSGQPLNSATFVSLPVNRVTVQFADQKGDAEGEDGAPPAAAQMGAPQQGATASPPRPAAALPQPSADRPLLTVPAPNLGGMSGIGGQAFNLVAPFDPLY